MLPLYLYVLPQLVSQLVLIQCRSPGCPSMSKVTRCAKSMRATKTTTRPTCPNRRTQTCPLWPSGFGRPAAKFVFMKNQTPEERICTFANFSEVIPNYCTHQTFIQTTIMFVWFRVLSQQSWPKVHFSFKQKGSKALNAMWTVDVASCNSQAGQQAARQRRAAPPDSFVVHLVRPIWTFVLNDSPR